jgi:small-conductance mechanosensitive channel
MMAIPQTASSDATAIAMSDLENGKKSASVNVESVDQRPILGRRKTTSEKIKVGGQALDMGYEGREDGLTKVGNFFWKIHKTSILTRYALYIIPVAALLAIPLVLTATIYADDTAKGVRLLGLFIWIEMIWVLLWLCKLCAQGAPIIFQAASGIVSTGIRKYTTVLIALEIPLSLFFWTISAFASSSSIICTFNTYDPRGNGTAPLPGANIPAGMFLKSACTEQDGERPWPLTLKRVFLAGIVVTAIFLAEKTIVQLISIDYHRKQYDAKIKESKKVIWLLDLLYEASRRLFPEFCKEFEEEDEAIQGNNVELRNTFAKTGMGTKVLNNMGRARDKATAAFGAMVSDVTGKRVFDSTSAHSIVIEALETERASKALARRLWLSFVGEGREELYKYDLIEVLGHDHTEQAEEIFAALDRDGNGDVSLDEMTMLVVSVGRDRKNRATSMHEIGQAIAVLDRLLSVVVLVAIAFIYAAFFSPNFSDKITSLWTTFTGLAFAIGGTVTEFLSCCIFLFIKHPYDVGDRVDINDTELIVEHISLMYSVFRRLDSDKTVQIPHNIANTLWVENISRSRAMKERVVLSVAATTTNEDILALRSELQKFVTADENRRDFQSEFDIELISVGNLLKLDLQVEIRHKSNFSNELVRSTRRNKFMCELLAAMRRIPIEPPGGSAPVLGDPANPSYSVTISDQEAINARAQHATEAQESRLFPTGTGATFLGDSLTTAFQNPAQSMIAGSKFFT